MNKALFISILLVTASACGILWEYRSLNTFEDMVWTDSDSLKFEFHIDKGARFDCIVLVRHAPGFNHRHLPISLSLNNDSMRSYNEYLIPVISDDGEYLGDGSVDLWDIEFTVIENLDFPSGNYTATISHTSNVTNVNRILEVGFMLKSAK